MKAAAVILSGAALAAGCAGARAPFLDDSALLAIQGPAARAAGVSSSCWIGAYRLRDGSVVDVGPADDTHLRWRRVDGTTGSLTRQADSSWASTLGWTGRPDGERVSFSDCRTAGINFGGVDGSRIPLHVTETRFQGAGVELAGRLVMPEGATLVPIVVLVHGSERRSARDFDFLQRLLPAMGIGAFVYDKRGTGDSGGRYSQDYLLLAEDAVAAAREARRLAGVRAERLGHLGTSQGGWVAPLAATIERVDFVVVSHGLAVSPLEEDREAIALDVSRRGYGPDVVARAMEIADASEAILTSGFQDGYDRLEAVRAKYQGEPWFRHIRGNVTFVLLESSPALLRRHGPQLLAGIPLQHDPIPVLRNLETPQLWILGEDDLEAPSAETARRLDALAREGRPIATAMFPRAEHGLYEYETTPDGTRLSTRNPDGYFALMRDFIRDGRLAGPYGTAVVQELGRAPEPARRRDRTAPAP